MVLYQHVEKWTIMSTLLPIITRGRPNFAGKFCSLINESIFYFIKAILRWFLRVRWIIRKQWRCWYCSLPSLAVCNCEIWLSIIAIIYSNMLILFFWSFMTSINPLKHSFVANLSSHFVKCSVIQSSRLSIVKPEGGKFFGFGELGLPKRDLVIFPLKSFE